VEHQALMDMVVAICEEIVAEIMGGGD